jgi:hypothetical protein
MPRILVKASIPVIAISLDNLACLYECTYRMNGRPVRKPTEPKLPPSLDAYVFKQRGKYGILRGIRNGLSRI